MHQYSFICIFLIFMIIFFINSYNMKEKCDCSKTEHMKAIAHKSNNILPDSNFMLFSSSEKGDVYKWTYSTSATTTSPEDYSDAIKGTKLEMPQGWVKGISPLAVSEKKILYVGGAIEYDVSEGKKNTLPSIVQFNNNGSTGYNPNTKGVLYPSLIKSSVIDKNFFSGRVDGLSVGAKTDSRVLAFTMSSVESSTTKQSYVGNHGPNGLNLFETEYHTGSLIPTAIATSITGSSFYRIGGLKCGSNNCNPSNPSTNAKTLNFDSIDSVGSITSKCISGICESYPPTGRYITLQGQVGTPSCIALSPNRKQLYIGYKDGMVLLIPTDDVKNPSVLAISTNVNGTIFRPDTLKNNFPVKSIVVDRTGNTVYASTSDDKKNTVIMVFMSMGIKSKWQDSNLDTCKAPTGVKIPLDSLLDDTDVNKPGTTIECMDVSPDNLTLYVGGGFISSKNSNSTKGWLAGLDTSYFRNQPSSANKSIGRIINKDQDSRILYIATYPGLTCPLQHSHPYSGLYGKNQPKGYKNMWCCSVEPSSPTICPTVINNEGNKCNTSDPDTWVSCNKYGDASLPIDMKLDCWGWRSVGITQITCKDTSEASCLYMANYAINILNEFKQTVKGEKKGTYIRNDPPTDSYDSPETIKWNRKGEIGFYVEIDNGEYSIKIQKEDDSKQLVIYFVTDQKNSIISRQQSITVKGGSIFKRFLDSPEEKVVDLVVKGEIYGLFNTTGYDRNFKDINEIIQNWLATQPKLQKLPVN